MGAEAGGPLEGIAACSPMSRDDLLDKGLQARVVIDRETAGRLGVTDRRDRYRACTMPSASG